MSDSARPDLPALDELETVVRRVTEQAGDWRRRALKAEADRAELGVDHDAVAARETIRELEQQNSELEARVRAAQARLEELLSRLQFLEEQVAAEEPAG